MEASLKRFAAPNTSLDRSAESLGSETLLNNDDSKELQPSRQENRTMMGSMTRIAAASIGLFMAGCQVPAPAGDTTPPDITVIVSNARGRNAFRSIDGLLKPPDNCIKVPGLPTQLVLIAGDAGGIESASISAFGGTIVPASVDVLPRAPEGSFSIRSDRGSDILSIALTPPSPSTVRTGATAIFQVNGKLPISITASARDRAGHVTQLPQFDLREPDSQVGCR